MYRCIETFADGRVRLLVDESGSNVPFMVTVIGDSFSQQFYEQGEAEAYAKERAVGIADKWQERYDTCPYCGNDLQEGYCPSCGAQWRNSMKKRSEYYSEMERDELVEALTMIDYRIVAELWDEAVDNGYADDDMGYAYFFPFDELADCANTGILNPIEVIEALLVCGGKGNVVLRDPICWGNFKQDDIRSGSYRDFVDEAVDFDTLADYIIENHIEL